MELDATAVFKYRLHTCTIKFTMSFLGNLPHLRRIKMMRLLAFYYSGNGYIPIFGRRFHSRLPPTRPSLNVRKVINIAHSSSVSLLVPLSSKVVFWQFLQVHKFDMCCGKRKGLAQFQNLPFFPFHAVNYGKGSNIVFYASNTCTVYFR